MRIPYTFAMALALLLAAGCAHEQENARYDESVSPAYSAGRMSDYNNDHNTAISPAVPGANSASGKSATQSDNAIVASVRESLQRNAEIAPIVPNIQISANNGAVILSGSVQSDEQKRQIEAIAQQATGVVAVNNQLQVLSSPLPRETSNQPGNPLLNPTSTGTNNPPALYKNAGSGVEHLDTNALTPSSPTSTVSNSPPRLYQDAGDGAANSKSNALNQTSRSNDAGRIYREQNGQPQTTDSNLSTNDSPMR